MKPYVATRGVVLILFAQVVLLAQMPAHAQQLQEREFSRFQNGTFGCQKEGEPCNYLTVHCCTGLVP